MAGSEFGAKVSGVEQTLAIRFGISLRVADERWYFAEYQQNLADLSERFSCKRALSSQLGRTETTSSLIHCGCSCKPLLTDSVMNFTKAESFGSGVLLRGHSRRKARLFFSEPASTSQRLPLRI
jgi:hypothetical protein